MGKSKYLEPKARERLREIIAARGEMTMDEAVEIVMPHIQFDFEDMKLQVAKRVCRNIFASIKDDSGVRTTFATKKSGKPTYIDIDRCKDAKSVRAVADDLYEKEKGITKSRQKARRRARVLEGQLEMDITKVQ